MVFCVSGTSKSICVFPNLLCKQGGRGSNPSRPPISLGSGPETCSERSEDIVYTLGPKGLFKACRVFSSRSKYPRS